MSETGLQDETGKEGTRPCRILQAELRSQEVIFILQILKSYLSTLSREVT